MPIALQTVGLLILSNVFMNFAWYGHLRFTNRSIYIVVLVSWGIAFFEYCLQVPANRIGFGIFSAPQLKVIQEAITFGVFSIISWAYLRQRPTLYDQAAFLLIIAAVAISLFQPKG